MTHVVTRRAALLASALTAAAGIATAAAPAAATTAAGARDAVVRPIHPLAHVKLPKTDRLVPSGVRRLRCRPVQHTAEATQARCASSHRGTTLLPLGPRVI